MLWIPRPVYELLPYLYMGIGAALVAGALLIDQGPRGLLMLLGAAVLTAGLVLWMRRRDYRATEREYDSHSLDR